VFKSLHGHSCIKSSKLADCFYKYLWKNRSLILFRGSVNSSVVGFKSIHEISSWQNIPRSTVYYNEVEAIGSKQSGRPHKITVQCAEVTNFMQIQIAIDLQIRLPFQLAQEHSVESSMEWVSRHWILEQKHIL